MAVTRNPNPVNKTMIPRQKTSACVQPLRLSPEPVVLWFRKNETVIGIIGNTHGVNRAARPKPKAVRRNGSMGPLLGLALAMGGCTEARNDAFGFSTAL